MQQCPKCGSRRVHHSRARSIWDKLRRRLSGKRPYRCRDCRARMWAVDSGPHFSPEAVEIASKAVAPDLKLTPFSRDDRSHHDLDLTDLDRSTGESS